ncbi:Uncharacterised protein [Mycobacteroides abscessus subsp. abscessus]|nr:Uncharacterised protein [Mycobacteroides abscessus subsp. abscessus]
MRTGCRMCEDITASGDAHHDGDQQGQTDGCEHGNPKRTRAVPQRYTDTRLIAAVCTPLPRHGHPVFGRWVPAVGGQVSVAQRHKPAEAEKHRTEQREPDGAIGHPRAQYQQRREQQHEKATKIELRCVARSPRHDHHYMKRANQ